MESNHQVNMASVFMLAASVAVAGAPWGCARANDNLPDVTDDASDLDDAVDQDGVPDGDGVTDETLDPGETSDPDAPPDVDADPVADPDADAPADPDIDIDAPRDPDVDEEVAAGPVISRVSPETVAHGAVVTLTGSGLSGTAVSVTLGGAAQTIIGNTATEIRFGPVSDAQAASAAPGDTDIIVTVDG